SIPDLALETGIDRFVKVHPPGTRQEAAKFLARASVLVNLPQDSHLAIPSKIFEYMQFESWLLALAKPNSATELLLRDTEADVVAPDDVDRLAHILHARYLQHREGRIPTPLAA